MKKSTIAFILVILLLAGYFAFNAEWGRTILTGFFSEDLKIIREKSLSFMEDIRFKDFDKAASYHHPDDRERADIPKMIERLFKIKPELLDIMEYEILDATLDSSKERGRVKVKSKVGLLNADKIKTPEMILYYHKKDEKWYMELESSLK